MISAITDDWSGAKLLCSVALARLPGAAAVAISLPRIKAEPSSTWLGKDSLLETPTLHGALHDEKEPF